MTISNQDMVDILSRPRRPRRNDAFEEPPELTAEDEAILDRCWRAEAEAHPSPTICGTMSDEETLEFFGLSKK